VFLKKLFFGTVEHLHELDQIITDHLENWSLDRLANIDRNLLRIAVYEMKYMEDVPYTVSINEAVEIAKRFGDEKSSRFINGVLAKVMETLGK
jgi:N utilization substance protein B